MTRTAGRKYYFADYCFDSKSAVLTRGGELVPLRCQAASLLLALLDAAPEPISRERLYSILWGDDSSVDVDGALNALVRELRVTLGKSSNKEALISTLPKRGYVFSAAINTRPDSGRPKPTRRMPLHVLLPLAALLAVVVSGLAVLHNIGKDASPADVEVVYDPPDPPGWQQGFSTDDAQWMVDNLIAARELRAQSGSDAMHRAISLYEAVLDRQPDNSEALAGKLLATTRIVSFTGYTEKGVYEEIEELARRLADAEQPSGGVDDLGLAFVRLYRDWQVREALRLTEASLAADPDNSDAHAIYASVKAVSGDLEGAIDSAATAMQLRPDSWSRADFCFYLLLGRQFDRAAKFCGRAYQNHPDELYLVIASAFSLHRLDRSREAIETIVDTIRRHEPTAYEDPESAPQSWRELGCERAEYFTHRLENASPAERRALVATLVNYWAQCGDKDEFLMWANQAVDVRDLSALYIPYDPRFDAFSDDPDFQRLVDGIRRMML